MPAYQVNKHVLRTSVEIPDRVWEPIVQVDELILDSTCSGAPEVPTTADMLDMLGKESDAVLDIRAAVGKPYQFYQATGIPSGWQTQGVVTEFGESVCRKVDVRAHPDKNGTYIARIEYTNFGRIKEFGTTPSAYIGDVPIRVNLTSPLTTKSIYRADAVYPGPSEVNSTGTGFDRNVWDSSGSELGGDPIDIAGQPVPFPIDTARITVEVVRRHLYLDWAGNYVNNDGDADTLCPANLQNFVGARNLDTCFGYPIGTVRCDAINVLPLHHEFKLYQYVFTYSEDKHSQQFTPAIAQGVPQLVESTGTSVRGLQAFEVYGNQPYLDGFNWQASAWPADEWAYLETFTCDP